MLFNVLAEQKNAVDYVLYSLKPYSLLQKAIYLLEFTWISLFWSHVLSQVAEEAWAYA